MDIKFFPVTVNDIEAIAELQPEGWTDITKAFRIYISAEFCWPVMLIHDGSIAGLGTLIDFGETAWLAHIIVSTQYRNKGLGQAMVNHLLSVANEKGLQSVSLFATPMGEPVYKKAGFEVINEYVTLKKNSDWPGFEVSDQIFTLNTDHYAAILELDRQFSGENRERMLSLNMQGGFVYIAYGELQGYYLPEFGEGLIQALNPEAGIELMKLKYATADQAIIPSENKVAIHFLLQNGFVHDGIRGRRMVYGHSFPWHPTAMYSRINGSLG